jgi:uracil-DNA glycosylase
MDTVRKLDRIHDKLLACQACCHVCGPPVHGPAVASPVLLVGQAPGVHEGERGRPFAHTAGKTLFKWLGSATDLSEAELRQCIYFSAIARCFPGKNLKGEGDREPSADEIENCRPFLRAEIMALKPKLILAVGRLAISEILGPTHFPKGTALVEVVGRRVRTRFHGHETDVIALPHPSGVSRWPLTEPGKSKLAAALRLLRRDFAKHLPTLPGTLS